MDALAQNDSAGGRIRFLLIHMLQMELLAVLLATALAALILYSFYKKQNNRTAEQVLSRNIAAAYTSVVLVLWLAGRLLR